MQAFIHTDNKGGDPGFIPRLFLLVELAVLDLVVEAGRFLAGDRVLEIRERSEGRLLSRVLTASSYPMILGSMFTVQF